MSKKILFLFLLFSAGIAQAQKLKKEDRQIIAHLQHHVLFLSDDKLEGRRTGSMGEKLAAEYISAQFKNIGLSPKGTKEFFQPFEVAEGKQLHPSTALSINNNQLQLGKDFFPLVYSIDTSLAASPSMALQEPGMPWFFDLKELMDENAANPHFDLNAAVANSAKQVLKRGGTAVFIYNSTGKPDGLKFDGKDKTEAPGIPVIYLSNEIAAKYLSDESAAVDIKLKVAIADKKRLGINVAGYIDNGAASTIIIGAHYDHLGYGEDGNSREVEKKTLVHNGADDNASGIAAMTELARLLKNAKHKSNNYLFLAFSGEELGLYGSKHFTQYPTIHLSTVNFMINLDMVGRLNDSSRTVTVGGYGTSPYWGEVYGLQGKKRLYAGDLKFRFDSSGTGPSDHTSFYLKNIPVLFYFTGLHSDYHKPTDDFNKINFNGTLGIVKHIFSLLETHEKQKSKLVFTKTRETQTTTSARFSVTLGIMPDYTFSGAGVRADGVSDNKPAQKAGLKAGDIIMSIGEHKINSLESYMQTLARFKKGDKAKVIYQRGDETLSTTVEF